MNSVALIILLLIIECVGVLVGLTIGYFLKRKLKEEWELEHELNQMRLDKIKSLEEQIKILKNININTSKKLK